ncbi:MAG: helix-turn-helix domain-containing protein, partial [Alphaproteobacteria bacterium]|nr:helix-turn-helix domain-containing protein [Alphaproteobacteria bacterium]
MNRSAREAIRQTVVGLRAAGLVADEEMARFRTLKGWKPKSRAFAAKDIKRLRRQHRLSQPVFARALGLGKSTIQQWEQGLKHPSGPSLKLLNIIHKHG